LLTVGKDQYYGYAINQNSITVCNFLNFSTTAIINARNAQQHQNGEDDTAGSVDLQSP